ncbi:hypothetical protein THMIRHAS_06050 [Thiosulfatimonas sediminis]|uniref:Photolyase/cryptochrome alpha/beta domain-containing protein n=1 Tax=Thiosulfatimonas sediminis TaxID=2675054 RepID=A0A6F8PSW9_9GAMM|nr:hypothetical protein [Thiosulfatimonas sediminis]BBP45232.1 hypothetical protein THMIRHAS_06050 [Thiosulfatimonas sediminis]
MCRLIWLHDEALALFNVDELLPEDRVVFVWDNDYFRNKGWSLSRMVFLYESLLDLPYPNLQVYQGETVSVLRQLVKQNEMAEVFVYRPFEPDLQEIAKELSKSVTMVLLDVPSSLTSPLTTVPPRFYKFWKQVEPEVLGKKLANTGRQKFH